MRKMIDLAVIPVIALANWGCGDEDRQPLAGTPLKMTVALRPAPDSGLIAIADEKGYFREAGLDVALKFYPAGYLAADAVTRGEADVGTVADVVFAARMSRQRELKVVASIGFSTGSQIVARKDRGIEVPQDLKGKRIGFTPDTTSHYFLYTFLLTENVSPAQIVPVPMSPDSQVKAVLRGEVDAVSAFDMYAFEASGKLGGNAVAWDCQNNLGYQWILVIKETATQSPECLKRFLKALIKSERFALADQREAMKITIRKLHLDPGLVEQSWSRVRLNVSLNQSVVTALRDYVSWKMDMEGGTGPAPDALDFIYTGALDDIAPGAVTIFR